MTKKELLDRCARSGEERVLLARVLDKLEQAQSRGIPAHTPFLSAACWRPGAIPATAFGAGTRRRSGGSAPCCPTGRRKRT